MTEEQWCNGVDPMPMLRFLQAAGRASERKLRLFGVACCHRIWPHLAGDPLRSALRVAERLADGEAPASERRAARRRVHDLQNMQPGVVLNRAAAALFALTHREARFAAEAAVFAAQARAAAETTWLSAECWTAVRAEQAVQCALLRDLFGNPFLNIAINPAWLAWNAGTVPALAAAIYAERLLPEGTLDRTRLAVLVDALEEAGCTDQQVIGHLRGPGPCVRGCHLVDLLCGKA